MSAMLIAGVLQHVIYYAWPQTFVAETCAHIVAHGKVQKLILYAAPGDKLIDQYNHSDGETM
ncbi:hypothetical protein KIN20_018354 [Parelaphostrongylus tenuis]|uniref:Uncharacterized protein n=1 Tax=Parelaphostrongylus tenuis TaxID=148309 RepID=A0AAD5QS47_PARTN|nr:hypothetical protein KIN20_018354 [Parelaphostrongylus tenuis]